MQFLRDLDPKIWYALVAGATWLLIYAWRRINLASWDALTRRSPLLQQLPAVVLSGLISAAPALGKPLGTAIVDILVGVLFGAGGGALLHNAMAASALPYTGGAPKQSPPKPTADVTVGDVVAEAARRP